MAVYFTTEDKMEQRLINQLVMGQSQWTYEPEINNEEKLWANFKSILENNNKAKLKGVPLTDQEFAQIKDQVSFTSFYKAAQWLTGENGIVKVDVQREDARLGTIRLDVFNRMEKAGGSSVYQVINQYRVPRRHDMGQDSRFDVTLLFNGLPLIHIELKNRSTSYMDAFRQIENYIEESKFTGLYSCVQVFVISNGASTRYFSANKRLNSQFLTRWVDKDNQPVEDLIKFADQVLTIPQAHELVTDYTVLDHDKKNVIVLRPYQIHAIQAVERSVRMGQSGYVWHTTGSGKTLTSYKVAKNLLQNPSLDKSIFIVDRVDLDQQTTSSFMSYAMHDSVNIDQTDNVSHLMENLLSKDRTVIVTTIQKLNYLMKLYRENPDDKTLSAIKNLKLSFVVDECHRAISSQKHEEIDQFFTNALWYGFTGTPIFAENAKAEIGDLARTTEEQYGPRLHEYTVKEAIFDNSVLGFQVEYKSTMEEETMVDLVEFYNPDLDAYDLDSKSLEEKIPSQYYEEDDHMLEVIDSIVNKSIRKFNLHRGMGQNFNAILTTSSIAKAQRYYELFKEVKEGKRDVKVSERTKKFSPDFPKVAITYSIGDNQEFSRVNKDKMTEALEDYNNMYGTSFGLSNIRAYNRDLNNRLARKDDKYWARSEQIDLVIVVDRLLTGFDAPSLAILFMDRAPMTPQGLIQAFSRTNRIYNKDKQYGQIVTFQTPSIYKMSVDEAFTLYSNGGENYIQAPIWEDILNNFKDALASLRAAASQPEDVIDFSSDVEKLGFVRAFQDFDKNFTAIQVYSEFDDESWEEDFNITMEEIEAYHDHYENVKEELKDRDPDDPSLDLIDINYEINSVHKDQIDYQYIVMLIQSQVPSDDKDQKEEKIIGSPKHIQEIEELIDRFKEDHPELGSLIEDIFQEVQRDGEAFRNKDIRQVLTDRIKEEQGQSIEKFAAKYLVDKDQLSYYAENYQPDKDGRQYGESELLDIKNLNYKEYNEKNNSSLKRFEYRNKLRKDLEQFVADEILPYEI